MKKIFLIFPLLLIISCGYTPLYSSKDSNYKVISFKKNIDNNLTNYIENSISVLKDAIIETVAEKILSQEKSVNVIDKNNKVIGSVKPSKIIQTVFGGRKENS